METPVSPYKLLFKALSLIPISHYLLFLSLIFLILVYNVLEFHILQDIFSAFGGQSVSLTFNSCSQIYQEVVSKCQLLHGSYRRELFRTSDGGTIALDWLMTSDVLETNFQVNRTHKDDKVPLVIVIPGLTSDSASPYIKHLAYKMAKHGWNVVVSNHRGLGGVPLTSDCFYTAGRTEDLREVVNYLHRRHLETPLFAVGTSLGANILVKYLGEDGANVPVVGAVSISNPWDLLVGDRFFSRGLMQRFYDRILANGLKNSAKLHQEIYTRLADWEGIEKARSVRDFNDYSARVAGNFVSIDSFHRWASSCRLVGNVMVPLLCINAIDDPVCTKESIPWDECRKNKNIVLATTPHGGHVAFFEGITAKSLWWVRVVEEFLSVLHSSPSVYKNEMKRSSLISPLESSKMNIEDLPNEHMFKSCKCENTTPDEYLVSQDSKKSV